MSAQPDEGGKKKGAARLDKDPESMNAKELKAAIKQVMKKMNQAAAELIDPSLSEMSPLNIPDELQATKEYVQPLGENESLFQDIWTAFKLG